MNKILKSFLVGGFFIALINYIIEKNVFKNAKKNAKFIALMTHGLPVIFVVSIILMNEKNRLDVVKEGAMVTIFILLVIGIMIGLYPHINFRLNLIMCIIVYFFIIKKYLYN